MQKENKKGGRASKINHQPKWNDNNVKNKICLTVTRGYIEWEIT